MKIFTKKFLNKRVAPDDGLDYTKHNSEKAEKQIYIPKKLWLELSKKSKNSNLLLSLIDIRGFDVVDTIFMAGVAVGWAECKRKVK